MKLKHPCRAHAGRRDDAEVVLGSDGETDGGSFGIRDLERGIDRDLVDVISGPGSDEGRGSGAESVLAALGALVACDEPGESDDDERRQRCRGADDDEQLTASCSECSDCEHRGSHERGGRQNGKPLPTEPLLRIGVRLRELDHRRVKRSRAPEHSSQHEQEVDGVAHPVPVVQRAEPVENVGHELENERRGDHREGRRAQPGSQNHASGQRDEQHVHDRERKSGRGLERGRALHEPRLHQECPADDGDAHRDDARVDEAGPVAPRRLPADHHEQRGGEDDVRPESQEVGCGRERDVTALLALDGVDSVGGDAAEAAYGDEVPRHLGSGPVDRDPEQRCSDGGDREELVPAVVVRGVARQRHVRQGERGGNEEERAIWARDVHRMPIGSNEAVVKRRC
jgi:hypothetical protein